MRESPRIRRLRTDLKALETLKADSSIFDFKVYGNPPDSYVVRFSGRGLARLNEHSPPQIRDAHDVAIRLGASYPRVIPELQWKTPIYHPNISGAGIVCLGGFGTHWAPSLNLDELCEMLWDMIRDQNFDVKSPYNRVAAACAANQRELRFPLDERPIRDLKAGASGPPEEPVMAEEVIFLGDTEVTDAEIVNAEIVDAEIVDPDEPDILIIE